MARSVAVQVPNFRLTKKQGQFFINEEYLEDLNICRQQDDFHEKLALQPALGTCSGFLVGKQTILTASHCLETKEECGNNFWVFNFKSDIPNLYPTSFSENNVYRCLEIESQNQELDYAFVKLDRPVFERSPLKMRTREKFPLTLDSSSLDTLKAASQIFGLIPKVRSNQNKTHFVINSDTFQGNSGSPVINTLNNLVEGILVRGGTDFDVNEKSDDLCYVIKRCHEGECVGEEIFKD